MFKWMSKEKEKNVKPTGLENFGNTCYINSIVQCLYHVSAFRDNLILENSTSSITKSLKDLFYKLGRRSSVSPTDLVSSLKKEFSSFRNLYHQDAQELFSFMMNDLILDFSSTSRQGKTGKKVNSWLQKLFIGTTSTTTTCLTCENTTTRNEEFLDLSLEINGDLLECLREFEKVELLDGLNKFYCEGECNGSYQEARKRIFILNFPPVLVIHLKRFKYSPEQEKFVKIKDSVPYPLHLNLGNRPYNLVSVCIHIGPGAHSGHYISIVKNSDEWFLVDDDAVTVHYFLLIIEFTTRFAAVFE
jgi:ubiquitin C-terminal hydrolase